MKTKNIIKASVVTCSLLIASGQAHALSSYLTDVNTAYGSSYADCLICHSTAAGGGTAVSNFAALYRANGLTALAIKDMDADNDGFTNIQEGMATSDMNLATSTPFTTAVAGIADVKLVSALVTGDALATEVAVADAYAYAAVTLAAGETVAGGTGVAVVANVLPVTLLFDAAVDANAKVYSVDTYTSVGTALVAGVDYTINASGSVSISALPAGLTQPSPLLVTRVAPVATVIPTAAGTTPVAGAAIPVDYETAERKPGCVAGNIAATGVMWFFLLIGMFAFRSKKDV